MKLARKAIELEQDNRLEEAESLKRIFNSRERAGYEALKKEYDQLMGYSGYDEINEQ